MNNKHWVSPLAFLLLNVIGWGVFLFFFVQLSAKDGGEKAAINAQTEKLESFTQKLDQQLESRDQQLREQVAALDQQMRTQIEEVRQQMNNQIEASKEVKVAPADPRRGVPDTRQLKKLETATARVEDELSNLRNHPHVTVDLNALVQGLRPNIFFDVVRIDARNTGVVDVTLQARNLGPYAAVVEGPDLVIATKPVPSAGTVEGQLSPAQDYTFKSARLGTLLPNQPMNIAYSVALNDAKQLDQPLYYKLTFKTNTDPTLVSTASRLLRGKLSEKEVQALSVSQQSHAGDLSVGRQKLAQ
ncbi:MAG: hypothetical protein ACREV9_12000 [Burkholderiales bacterium]